MTFQSDSWSDVVFTDDYLKSTHKLNILRQNVFRLNQDKSP